MAFKTVKVCPLAQGWARDISIGSEYNYRFRVGIIPNHVTSAVVLKQYCDLMSQYFCDTLSEVIGDTGGWVSLEGLDLGRNSSSFLDIYTSTIDWFMIIMLSDNIDHTRFKQSVLRIEERIRGEKGT